MDTWEHDLSAPPVLDQLSLADTVRLARDCLTVYVAPPPENKSEKSSLDRCIRNALHLICEADRQRDASVFLGLCWASIEALVTLRRQDGTVQQIAQNTSVLLEPDRYQRQAAMSYVKKRYATRCDVLHGRKVEHIELEKLWPRAIVASLIQAHMQFRQFRLRMGREFVRDEFADELEKTFSSGTILPGVEATPAARLWA